MHMYASTFICTHIHTLLTYINVLYMCVYIYIKDPSGCDRRPRLGSGPLCMFWASGYAQPCGGCYCCFCVPSWSQDGAKMGPSHCSALDRPVLRCTLHPAPFAIAHCFAKPTQQPLHRNPRRRSRGQKKGPCLRRIICKVSNDRLFSPMRHGLRDYVAARDQRSRSGCHP